ncbi:TetR family transcriptional regulator [Leucobacter viscericola]|uniref:TetR family transcriptional regulator n=1 Tax=Leucobacter viscericola TaxID=2714935 RepID=A0A6G7XG82_9MICO|nr:TetR family transcriptional regulator [Leucobacter viscericola]QIK63620.1 TetR family transcriptional regulator [Leucobacter viscericola]
MTAAAPRRTRLDQRVIVDALLELARAEPGVRPTFKRLGEALGVDATAMYRHFRNKDELTRAALDRLAETAVAHALAAEGSWRERLEVYLARAAELSLEYPSVAIEGAVLDPAGPGDVSADELILGLLSEAGLEGAALIRAYAAVSGFAVSQNAALAHEVMRNGAAARDGSTPWISTFGAVDLAQYPLVREHRDALLAIDGLTVYRAGVAAILDSIERSAQDLGE